MRFRPYNDDDLATYNSEVARGIVHTKEYVEEMARLQLAFDLRPFSSIEQYEEAQRRGYFLTNYKGEVLPYV